MNKSAIYKRAFESWKAKPGSTVYISTTDTAKAIRALLKAKFPGTKFSVRSSKYSGGSSIRIGWTDGPTAKLVDAYVQPFSGAGFDGMIDMKFYKDAWFYPDGSASYGSTGGTVGSAGVYPVENPEPAKDGAIPVSFSADYVFTERKYSKESMERALIAYRAKWGDEAAEGIVVKVSGYDGSAYADSTIPGFDKIEAVREVRNMATRRMLPDAMPKMEAA